MEEEIFDEEFNEDSFSYTEDSYIDEGSYPEEVDVQVEEKIISLEEDEIEVDKLKINVRELKQITPAQCFIDNKAMVTVFFQRVHDEDGKKSIISTPYLITSNREKINLNSNDLLKLGYYSDRNPNYENRWERESAEEFLGGKKNEHPLSSIIEMIKDCYSSNIYLADSRWKNVLSCWVIGTYFHRAFNTFPYIHLNGNMSAGKSKTLTLTMLLSFNGEMSVTSTPSYLTRSINDNNASCGIDEAEALGSKDENQVLLAIFNSGYKKGTSIGKSESSSKNSWTVKRFDPYSPKIFSGIKRLAPTLISRSIPITMIKTDNKEIINSEVNTESEVYQRIRNYLYFSMMEDFEPIIQIYKELEDDGIVGREFELWRPLLSIAKYIDNGMYVEMREFAIEIQEQKKEIMEEDTSALKLLESLLILTTEVNPKTDPFYTAQEIQDFLTDTRNVNSDSFSWMGQTKTHSRWIGDELRKAGVIKGSAIQKKVGGTNNRYFYLDEKIIEEKVKIHKHS